MAELDAFEARFAAAYRRYLDEVPTTVDAAAVARAVAVERPRALGRAWPWAFAPSRTLAWLVLVALLVAALGAAVFVGSHRSALGFSCPAGTDPGRPGPIGQSRPPLSYGTAMAFDRDAGRLVLVVQGYSSSVQTWTFDVCTNTWFRMHPDQEPYGAGQLVYDAGRRLTIMLEVGGTLPRVWAYDIGTNTWSARGIVPFSGGRPRLAYDPDLERVVALVPGGWDVSGSADPPALWTYDSRMDAWAPVPGSGPASAETANAELIAYDTSIDRLVWARDMGYTGVIESRASDIRMLDVRTGTWSTSRARAPDVFFAWGASGSEIAYDEATHRTILFGGGRMVAYDAAADRWDVLQWNDALSADSAHHPVPSRVRSYHAIAYDPVNERILLYGGQYTVWSGDVGTSVQSDDVLAFDAGTGRWLTLLEKTAEQPLR